MVLSRLDHPHDPNVFNLEHVVQDSTLKSEDGLDLHEKSTADASEVPSSTEMEISSDELSHLASGRKTVLLMCFVSHLPPPPLSPI